MQHERAQRGEEDDDAKQPVMAAPWTRRHESVISLTHILFGANIAVFLAMALASGSVLDFSGQMVVHFGANFGPYTLSGEWWRLVTYMFLHGGLLHIAFNMWCLWDLGSLCEALYGRATYAAIYFLTGIAGGLASIAWNPGTLTVGASGAIFGLAGALIASFYLGEFSLPRVAIQGTLRSLLFFVGFNVLFGAMITGIDNACHAGGLVSGLIVGALIAKLAPQHDLRRVGVLLFMVLVVVTGAFGVRQWRGAGMRFARSWITGNGNLDQRIGELKKKIQQSPDDVAAHYSLAHAYLSNGQFHEGESELRRVLELQPQNMRARMDLGAAYLGQDQAKEAQEEFTKVIAQDPNHAGAHAGLGVALADQGQHASAINEYKTALQLEPRARGIYYRMGLSQAQLKQYDDAIASYSKEKEKGEDDAALENALADVYQAKGMTQQAQEARTKASQLDGGQRE